MSNKHVPPQTTSGISRIGFAPADLVHLATLAQRGSRALRVVVPSRSARSSVVHGRTALSFGTLGFVLLAGCTSSVQGDETQTTADPMGDSGDTSNANSNDSHYDASVEDTTSSDDPESTTTKPANSSTKTSTSSSNVVSPGTSTAATVNPSTENDASANETAEESGTDATNTSSIDAGDTETSSTDTTDPLPGGRDIFVALGHGQRTLVSCDDGLTWTHNRFTDDIPLTGTDTDHIPFSMRAASYDAGAFYIAWGWGDPSYVERSVDGVNWTGVYGTPTDRTGADYVWGLVAGGGKVVMGENQLYYYTMDDGSNWDTIESGIVSAKPVFGYGDGAFVVVSEGGTNPEQQGSPTFRRSDDGITWSDDVDFPTDCLGGRTTRIPFGNGTFVLALRDHICSSSDGGRTWQYRPSPAGEMYTSVFDGSRFVAMNRNNILYASSDGLDWEQIGQFPGPMSYEAALGASTTTGTLVAVRSNVFYRSNDGGATFDELPSTDYIDEGGPLMQIEFGTVASSPACP
jgi:hypothetical protein